jgi:two-component system sensor histidine kinase/response regulator
MTSVDASNASGRVLVVDDSQADLEMLERRLERAGYAAVGVSGGAAALELIGRERIDAILLDIIMPGLDGLQTLTRIRESHSPSELPVIMVTARDEPDDVAAALAAGANDYVTKPINFTIADARIHAQLARKRAEDKLRNALAAATHAAQDKTEFLAMMSHELRTPLNAIIGFADLIGARPDDRQRAEWAGHIRHSGEHLLELINNVIELARAGLGNVAVEPEPVDLVEHCRNVLALVMPLAGRNGNELVLECTPHIGTLITDRLKLKQCLINLLGNACKFTENGRVALIVRVDREAPETWIEFAVEDTGIGIAEEHRDRLFRVFSQAEASIARRFGGTGLGLARTARRIGLRGGRIDMRSTAGEGSVFSLFLPARDGLWHPAEPRRGADARETVHV